MHCYITVLTLSLLVWECFSFLFLIHEKLHIILLHGLHLPSNKSLHSTVKPQHPGRISLNIEL